MLARLTFTFVLALFCCLTWVDAAAPPPRLSPEKQKRWQQAEIAFRRASTLLMQGKEAEAIEAIRQGLGIEREVFGRFRVGSSGWLQRLAFLLEKKGDWTAANGVRAEAVEVLQQAYGQGHWGVIDACLARSHTQRLSKMSADGRRRLAEADEIHQRALKQANQGKYKAAVPLGMRVLRTRLELLGETDPATMTALSNLGWYYRDTGEYARALRLLSWTLRLRKRVLGERHPDYALSLNVLGWLYLYQGKYSRGEPLFLHAARIYRETYGEKSADYATTLNNLISLYYETGNYKIALPLCRKVLAMRKEALGEKHLDYVTSLNNLALLYHELQDYKAALPLYQKVLAIRKEVLGEKHRNYATSLHNLAGLYQAMGDYKAAIPLCQQALAINKEVLGEKDRDYANTLALLVLIYNGMGDYQAALPLCQKALAIRKEVLGERHPDYATSLHSLAYLYKMTGKYKEALALYQKVLALDKETLGERHPYLATTLFNLASVYQDMGNPRAALPLCQQALAIRKELVGEKHSYYAGTLLRVAAIHQSLNEPEEARRLSEQSLAAIRANLLLAMAVQSERQQLVSQLDASNHLDFRLSLPDSGREGPAASYRHVLAWKGTVFLQQQQRRQFARLLTAADPRVHNLVERLRQTTRLLAALTLAPVDPRKAQTRRDQAEKLTRQEEDLQSQLARLSTEFRQQRMQADTTMADIQKLLPDDTVLVDFLVYTHHDHTQRSQRMRWQRRMAAWLIRRGRPLVRLDLGPVEPIEEVITAWRQKLVRPEQDSTKQAQALHKLIWQPLVKYLAGVKTVLISPDGALARVPFAALPGSKPNTYLIEDVALAVVPMPQLLPSLLAPAGLPGTPSLLLVGDVDFDTKVNLLTKAADRTRGAPRGSLKGWKALPGTWAEVNAIGKLFLSRHPKGRLSTLRQSAATRQATRQAMLESRYIHLATHGFFAPPDIQSALAGRARPGEMIGREGVTGWNPLLLSGVVLAGANKEAGSGEQDGILTALEVSEMDLPGCELVVLSACETGLGQQAGGEGLLGLQRALQVGGAKSVVASLWKVDDRATSELMIAFYKALWDSKRPLSKIEALRQAQLTMLRQGRKRGWVAEGEEDGAVPPMYWAGFILSGDWR
jgi:CHAT domain-containing protein